MKIKKIINNNVVLISQNQQEIVVMGKGLGFAKKPNDFLDENKIEKTFVLDNFKNWKHLSEIYQKMSNEEILFVNEIVNNAQKTLQVKMNSNIYLFLADHLHYALERAKQNLFLRNPLSSEIRQYYKKEYAIGLKAIAEIEQKFHVLLQEDEAAAIALHIVNACQNSTNIAQTIKITKIVDDIIRIIRLSYLIEFDKNGLDYNRLIIHLQHFAQRVILKKVMTPQIQELYQQVIQTYPQALACITKIEEYLFQNFAFVLSNDEKTYLIIHIQRILTSQAK